MIIYTKEQCIIKSRGIKKLDGTKVINYKLPRTMQEII